MAVGAVARRRSRRRFRRRRRPGRDRPHGLRLVDTREWTSRIVDGDARWFWIGAGKLVVPVYGGACAGRAVRLELRTYGARGGARSRVCESGLRGDFAYAGDYAYLYREGGPTTVVHLGRGEVVARVRGPELLIVAPR